MARRVLDQYDMEAEKEGAAILKHKCSLPSVIGKRLFKQREQSKRGDKIQQRTIERRYFKA